MSNIKKIRTRRTKYTFSLPGIDIDQLNQLYNITIVSNITYNTQSTDSTTKLSEINNENQTEDFFSFYDDSKHNHRCIIYMIDYSTKEKLNRYNCYWDKNTFTTSPIGCPIKYIYNQVVKSYFSEISRDIYTIKENITKERELHIKNDKRFTVNTNDYYETDGCFCSFNCCMSFINDNKHNILYNKSKNLLIKMYNNIFNTNISVIEPAPHWRLLIEYGGVLSINIFRNNINKIDYEDHGIIRQKSIGNIFEERINF